MADVFISYASEDRESARRLAEHLETIGCSVWWDRRLVPGSGYSRMISDELAAADRVIVLWSSASVESEWVDIEAAFARERGKLVPALIEPVEARIPLEFSRLHAANLIGWQGEPSHPELASLIAAIRPPAEPAATAADVEDLLQRAGEALQREDLETAVSLFEAALDAGLAGKEEVAVLLMVGFAYESLRRFGEAKVAYQRALDLDPRHSRVAWMLLGKVHRELDELEEAERCFRRALEIDPDYADAHTELGLLYVDRDEPQRALQSFLRVAAIDPDDPQVQVNVAAAFADLGRFDEAEAALERAVANGYERADEVRAVIDKLRRQPR